ncbi:hypothetical protein [Streptomyces spongiae]|uniref:Uncharacterized protein n=1 Tax=Streptomyces spongiae TaxID=565072 RepID=A0A5N8Y0X2_9ACTN|nr:hypothetical protein [Streptomyces spongiae]MPY65078.1 hypothetical protein [Streptomyces spongiae]
MFNSKKIATAAAAGVLGGFALVGAGSAQAFTADGPGKCVDDGKGQVRCERVNKRQFVSDSLGNFLLVNNSTQSCLGSRGQVACVSDVVVPDGKS